jgi:amidohydrolase
MVTALQTVVSRNVDPLEAAVVSVGKIQGGGAFNVIPAEVELVGTIRTLAPEIRDTVVRRMHEMLQGVGAACGVEVALKIESGTPAVINAAEVAEVVRVSAGVVVGAEKVLDAYRTMGSEDAAFFMQAVPGCYCLVGSANAERGLDAPHHNPRFDIDEDVLPLAVETLMGTLRHYLL